LRRVIHDRTARRVLGLEVELQAEIVELRGSSETFHVKQLAQEAVRELLPVARIRNRIAVGVRPTAMVG